jgi:uncharacterized protein YceK
MNDERSQESRTVGIGFIDILSVLALVVFFGCATVVVKHMSRAGAVVYQASLKLRRRARL